MPLTPPRHRDAAGTINATIGIVKEWGCKNIVIMTVIASRSGIESLLATHPDVRVHVAAIDDELTEVGAFLECAPLASWP